MAHSLSGLRIFVVGATGHLGRSVAIAARARGARVMGHGRDGTRRATLEGDDIKLARALDPFNDPALDDFRPDVSINCAGIAGGTMRYRAFHDANVEVVADLARFHQRIGHGRIVLVSSPSVVYRPGDHFAISEDEPYSLPVSPYARSRQEAEKVLIASGLPHAIVRFRAAYRPGMPSMVTKLARQIEGGVIPLVRDGTVRIDLLHLDDGVDALLALAALSGKSSGIFNIAGPEPVAFRTLVEKIAGEMGVTPRFVKVPARVLRLGAGLTEPLFARLMTDRDPPLPRHAAGALCYSQTLDLTRIISATGWSPRIAPTQSRLM